MNLRFLLDSHIAVRWLGIPKRLSRDQARVLREVGRRSEPVGISAVSLIEIAVMRDDRGGLGNIEMLGAIASSPAFQIIPIGLEVATEVAMIGRFLQDPADRAIVSTARVHKLTLITSDERIIQSKLCPVV